METTHNIQRTFTVKQFQNIIGNKMYNSLYSFFISGICRLFSVIRCQKLEFAKHIILLTQASLLLRYNCKARQWNEFQVNQLAKH